MAPENYEMPGHIPALSGFVFWSEFFVRPVDQFLYQSVQAYAAAYIEDSADIVLTGGYVRDRTLGLEPKDMDFLWIGDPNDTSVVEEWVGTLDESKITGLKWFLNYMSPTSQACIVRFWYDGREVNVLRSVHGTTTSPLEAVQQYNCTMNQIWYEEPLGIMFPTLLHKQLWGQKINIWNASWREFQIESLNKYRQKFPDWEHHSNLSSMLDPAIRS